MNILFNKSNFVLAASLLITTAALAQQGVGTDTPEKSSVLELKSTKRGLLVPRIALTKTNVEAPVHLPANSLLVYNTNTTTGANKVEPGYYYWSQDDSSWMRIINQKDIDTAISNIGDTKVTSAELSGTTLKIKQNGVATDVTVNLAALVKTYTGDNTSIKIDGTTVKRMALTGDVKADEGSGVVTVEKLRGKSISTTPPQPGQVLQWDGYIYKPVNMPLTYVGDDTSIKVSGANIKRAALTGDVEAAEGSSVTKVTKIQGQAISATAPTTSGQVLKWNGTAWAPANDADTQSKETVSSGDASIIDVTASGGPLNKDYAVKIKGAGASETKVLQSVNGTVKWVEASSGATLNEITGDIREVSAITPEEWAKPNTFALVQTSGAQIKLPDPSGYTNRIISVNNQFNAMLTYFNTNKPKNASTLASGKAHLLMSSGSQWYIIGGSY